MIQHVSNKIFLPSHSQLHKKSCMHTAAISRVLEQKGEPTSVLQSDPGLPELQHSHSLLLSEFTASLPGDFQVVPWHPICKTEHHFVTPLFSINLYVSCFDLNQLTCSALSLLISGLSFNNNNAVRLTVTGCAFNNKIKGLKIQSHHIYWVKHHGFMAKVA